MIIDEEENSEQQHTDERTSQLSIPATIETNPPSIISDPMTFFYDTSYGYSVSSLIAHPEASLTFGPPELVDEWYTEEVDYTPFVPLCKWTFRRHQSPSHEDPFQEVKILPGTARYDTTSSSLSRKSVVDDIYKR
jgi:hypothetical protein